MKMKKEQNKLGSFFFWSETPKTAAQGVLDAKEQQGKRQKGSVVARMFGHVVGLGYFKTATDK